jgi:ribonuclease P protein component
VDERLTRAERIRQRPEYLHIQGKGRKIHTANFICFGMLRGRPLQDGPQDGRQDGSQHGSGPAARLGITVSRRVGGAVVRNRLKRLVREAYRRQKAAFPAGTELVVIARPEATRAAYADVFAELEEVSRRIRSGGARSRSQ